MSALYLLPVIGALIGWITNYLAVKMLFHPKEPVRLFFYSVQGVFPKRQRALAERLGEIVSTELFSFDDLRTVLKQRAESDGFRRIIDGHIEKLLTVKLVELIPMVAMVMTPEIKEKVKGLILGELQQVFDNIADELAENPEGALDIHAVVEEKVSNFSSDKLEQILFAIMKKEFRFIELVGAVLGFFIGLVQVGIATLSL